MACSVKSHIKRCNNCSKSQIGTGPAVVKPIIENEMVLGTPARSIEDFRKLQKAPKAFSAVEDEERSKKDV